MVERTMFSEKKYRTGRPIEGLLKQISRLQQFKKKKRRKFDELTDREIEVLSLVAGGMNNPAIAEDLDISRATVQNHRSNIRAKLDIRNEAEYVKYALAYDLIKL